MQAKDIFSSSKFLSTGLRASAYQYIAMVSSYVFNGLIYIYILRKLDLEEFGLYSFLLTSIFLFRTIAFLGTDSVVQRYLPEYEERGDSYSAKRVLIGCMIVSFLAALLLCGLLLLFKNPIVTIFNLPESTKCFTWLVTVIVLLLVQSYLLGDVALVSLFKTRYVSFCRIFYNIVKLVLFYLALRMNYGIGGILRAWLLSELLFLILISIKVWHSILLVPTGSHSFHPLPIDRFVHFAKYLYLNRLIYALRSQGVAIYILSYFFNITIVGIYSFCFGLPLLLMQLSPAIALHSLFKSIVIKCHTKNQNYQDFSYLFKLFNRVTFFIMVPIMVFCIILADKIVLLLLNPDYMNMVHLFRLSLFLVMLYQFGFIYMPFIFATEKTKIIFITGLILLSSIVLAIILIPSYGVLGAICAFGITGLAVIIYLYWAINKMIRLAYPWQSLAVFFINMLLAASVVYILRAFINNVFSLVVVVTAGVIAYITFSYVNKGFTQQDRDYINCAFNKNVWFF